MDFIVDLPFMTHKFDSIWVISTHFIPIHMNYDVHKYVGDLHSSRVMQTQSFKHDHLWLRFAICRSLLGATTRIPQDSLDPQFSLSSIDAWQNWASQPNPWRYWEPMFWNIRDVGTRIYPGSSSLTLIVIKIVWRWHPSKCYMGNNVVRRSIGPSLVRKWN
jgi:hypothetical protein